MNKLIITTLCLSVLLSFDFLSAQTRELPRSNQDDQERDFRLPNRKSFFDRDKLEFFDKEKQQLPLDIQMQALEGAIDPESYIVGPGDQFYITIWSTLENSIPAQVSPEGKLIIPTVGALDVDGKPLIQVQDLVAEAASAKYLNSVISVNLARVRQIRVHVTGQVMNPGPYNALAVHRVSDIVEKAGGLTSWAFERGVQVRHRDGTTDIVDLHKYQNLGDLQTNLILRGGDVVHIPSIDVHQSTVRVEGAVNDPGTYQLIPGETIDDFLLRVNALSRRADLDKAFVERKNGANGQVEVIPVLPYLGASSNGRSDLVLQSGDVVKVPQRQEDVYVVGAVQQPGSYPFMPGMNIQDYVGLAGAIYQGSEPHKAKVIRHGTDQKEEGSDVPVGPGDTVYVPRARDFGFREILLVVGQAAQVLIALSVTGVFD